MFDNIVPDWSYVTSWIVAALSLLVLIFALLKIDSAHTDRHLRGKDVSYVPHTILAVVAFLTAAVLGVGGGILMEYRHQQIHDTALDRLHDTYDAEVHELPDNPLHEVIDGDPVPVSVYVNETVYTDTYGALYRDTVDDIELVYLDAGDQVAPAPSDLTTSN